MEDTTKIYIGKVLKRLRKSQQLSQEGLANRTPFDRSYISILERDLKKPRLDTIMDLAAGLDMKASDFVKEIEEHPENKWLIEQFQNTAPRIFQLLITCSFYSFLL